MFYDRGPRSSESCSNWPYKCRSCLCCRRQTHIDPNQGPWTSIQIGGEFFSSYCDESKRTRVGKLSVATHLCEAISQLVALNIVTSKVANCTHQDLFVLAHESNSGIAFGTENASWHRRVMIVVKILAGALHVGCTNRAHVSRVIQLFRQVWIKASNSPIVSPPESGMGQDPFLIILSVIVPSIGWILERQTKSLFTRLSYDESASHHSEPRGGTGTVMRVPRQAAC